MHVPSPIRIGKLTAAIIVITLQACGGKAPAPKAASATAPEQPGGAVVEPVTTLPEQAGSAVGAPVATLPEPSGAAPANAPEVQRLDETAQVQPVVATNKRALELSGEAKGTIDLSKERHGCSGVAALVPNHVIAATPGLIRFEITASETGPAPSLYIKLPDGRVECGTHDVRGKITVQSSTGRGNIRVWVGASAFDAATKYQLRITTKAPPAKPQPGVEITDAVPDYSELVVGKPIRFHCVAFRTDKVMYWTPKGGPQFEIGSRERGPYISVATRTKGGEWYEQIDVPEGLARGACVQIVMKADTRLLVSAERPPSASNDPGQLMLWLLAYDKTNQVSIVSTWQGTAGDARPAWGK